MTRRAPSIHICARRVWLDLTRLGAKLEQHQLAPVVKLNAEPVPAHLVSLELMREPLVIHPGGPADSVESAFELHLAGYRKPRERNVVRRLPGSIRLLADAARSVNYSRLKRIESKIESKLLSSRFEGLSIV